MTSGKKKLGSALLPFDQGHMALESKLPWRQDAGFHHIAAPPLNRLG